MNIKSKIYCDVLVIGSGIAGIRAAVEASSRGAKVVMVSKGKAGYTGSTFYPNTPLWGPNTVCDKNDEDIFYNEIIQTGYGAAIPRLAEVFAQNTKNSVTWLDALGFGTSCAKDMGSDEKPCFGKSTRSIYTRVNTMAGARKTLLRHVEKHDIERLENVTITDLYIEDSRCCGAVGVDRFDEFIIFESKTTVLATGGAESLWKHNSLTEDIEGNGYSLLLKEGAKCCNLEYIQFIPAFTNPFNKMHLVQGIIHDGADLINAKGEKVLPKYLASGLTKKQCLEERAKHGPFSCEYPSMYFDIAMHEECAKENGFESTGLRMVLPHNVKNYGYWHINGYIEWLREKGIDIFNDDMILYPHCQGFNGGGFIDENAETQIENLFACGEAAGGIHGADRIGGNGISAGLVFGEIAGREAAEKAAKTVSSSLPEAGTLKRLKKTLERNYSSNGTKDLICLWDVKKTIKNIMHESAGVVREQNSIDSAISRIRELYCQFDVMYWIEAGYVRKALESANCIVAAEAILSAISQRKDSRGSHYRKDYQEKNTAFGTWSLTEWDEQSGGKTSIEKVL